MGYPSLSAISEAAQRLTYVNSDHDLIRTVGLWHVLIFLRHRRLHGRREEYTFNAYDLAEACFDLNGVRLPIIRTTPYAYYEPGATIGSSPLQFFRRGEGPRQTYLNRVQTGLSGQGPRMPQLFTISGATLPITVSLVPDWIQRLRSYSANEFVLDNRIQALITWVFRFGVPRRSSDNASIAIAHHSGNGSLEPSSDLSLAGLPETAADVAGLVTDYFGLSDSEGAHLLPTLYGSGLFSGMTGVDPSIWAEETSVGFTEVGEEIRRLFMPTETSPQSPNMTAFRSPVEGEPTVDWDALTLDVLTSCPLTGLEDALERCVAALRAGKFVILLGPPGTGKTVLATSIGAAAVSSGAPGYTMATATSEWTTFETMGGYIPKRGEPGVLTFARRLVTESLASGHWLIIDELNRADIDKAFGELFTLFAGERVQLPVRDDDDKPIVLVPPGRSADPTHESPIYQAANWRMIGTMNTFDKASLYQLSYAFMRRFAFVEVPVPSRDDYEDILSRQATEMLTDVTFRDEALTYLKAIFCPEDEGIGAIGLRVGPAIPIDILKFLRERHLLAGALARTSDAQRQVLEGLEMYLYPQFEGHDIDHEKILDAVRRALSLDDTQVIKTGRQLAVWTGFERRAT